MPFLRIEQLENDIKSKKDALQNLKNENQVLHNIQKNQQKALNQFSQKYDNKNEIKLLQEKLRSLKEEFKYSKDLYKSTETKLKSQNNTIIIMEEKCKKIREKIEYMKNKENKPQEDQVSFCFLIY